MKTYSWLNSGFTLFAIVAVAGIIVLTPYVEADKSHEYHVRVFSGGTNIAEFCGTPDYIYNREVPGYAFRDKATDKPRSVLGEFDITDGCEDLPAR